MKLSTNPDQKNCSIFVRIKNNRQFRTKLFLRISLFSNLIYSLFLFTVSLIDNSEWFFVMCVYYILLFTTRIYILTKIRPHQQARIKLNAMRACGYFLLLINLVFSAMMFLLIRRNHTIAHHEITVIALATHTFFSLSTAVIGSIRYFKNNHPLYFCVKIINLIPASVSLVTLTSTMLTTFGENNLLLRSIILPTLSGVVSLLIIACAILMIYKAYSSTKKVEK